MSDTPAAETLLDMPNEQYHRTAAASKSTLDLVAQSPALVPWSRAAPEDEEAASQIDIGNAFEALLLEPERFAATYLVDTALNKSTKEGKAEAAAVREQADEAGAAILTPKQYAQVHLMQRSALAHPVVASLLGQRIAAQRSWFWFDEDTGVDCKCRPDVMLTGRPVVADIKISGQIDRFANSVHDYRYHVQAALYSDAYYWATGKPLKAYGFLAIEETLPHPAQLYVLDDEAMELGRRLYRRDLNTYAHCVQTGEWPSYADEPKTLSLPHWAINKTETELEGD